MKLLINTSTLAGTGVTQVAVSFINECKKFSENEYYVFLSPTVSRNINYNDFPSNFKFYEFGKKWLYSLKGFPDILKMKKLERKIHPDAVFSVFGPSLWKPKSPHLMGYAYPHYVYPDSPLFSMLDIKSRVGIAIRQFLHMSLLKHEGDYFVCETEDVALRLCKYHHIKKHCVFTAYNTASSVFLNYKSGLIQDREDFVFYSLCTPYIHKNLSILNEVIPALKDRKLKKNVKFYVTFPEEDYLRMFNSETRRYVKNAGFINISDCPKFVDNCDAMFLPTLLECYSASYPEAMALKKPIITSNLTFATNVCGDAALYFNPLDGSQIADKIEQLVNNEPLYQDLVEKGKRRIAFFGGPEMRAKKYLEICQSISK